MAETDWVAGVRRIGLCLAAAACTFAIPATASAAGIAFGVPLPPDASLGTLSLGSTATAAPVAVSISAPLQTWGLYVADAGSTSSSPGHLLRASGCSGGAASLASALHLASTAPLPTTTLDRASYDLTGTSTRIAHGTTSDAVSVTFGQPVGSSEQLPASCQYSVTLTWTLLSS
jgi:hypothetical protein